MSFSDLLLIAIGVSMDAFAVALSKGLGMRKLNYRHALIIALFFGGFQAVMPFIGWLLGRQFEQYITSFDHWIAFILLLLIGIKMIKEAFENNTGCKACTDAIDYKELLILSVATSIDALAVGITLAFLNVPILSTVGVIGLTTLILCFMGVVIGNRFGLKFKKNAEIAGGVVLILIGVKILLSHLGILF
ncbi:manganese efflux pump MntP family protein [Acetobacterium bakii]|uniref:Putative manganese efflux pump MntP n=1 Tax=Acetobacterium bakii TaxID=52689 RepID=A0A0L6TZG9_9FIRM|nr:manganese efflux pump MntP family protein [Acetobacterium bakii]KNZ40950.1 membrane protein [Acetobacterium bakii]